MPRRTLKQRLATPGFADGVRRARAKLDAQDEGFVVLRPQHYRALNAVAKAADPVSSPGHPARCNCHFCWLRRQRLARAIERLRKAEKP